MLSSHGDCVLILFISLAFGFVHDLIKMINCFAPIYVHTRKAGKNLETASKRSRNRAIIWEEKIGATLHLSQCGWFLPCVILQTGFVVVNAAHWITWCVHNVFRLSSALQEPLKSWCYPGKGTSAKHLLQGHTFPSQLLLLSYSSCSHYAF